MRSVRLLFIAILGMAVIPCRTGYAQSNTQASAALTGQVSSKEEGPMEGVLVTIKKAGSTATTVVSDEQDYYQFPAMGRSGSLRD